MTPKTTTQDDFLCRLAEALGWPRYHKVDPTPSLWLPDGTNRQPDWLLTPAGLLYLVARARAEGWSVTTYRPSRDFMVKVRLYKSPKLIVKMDMSEPLATAYAVAKMLKVPLPVGVE